MHLPIFFDTFSNFGLDFVADFGFMWVIRMCVQSSQIPGMKKKSLNFRTVAFSNFNFSFTDDSIVHTIILPD